MSSAVISIIVPSYNRAHLIGKTLDSILVQSYQNWECIIVDDNSSDDTKYVVEKYIGRDRRFQFYIKPKNLPKGPSASRNYGFAKSKGNYINWMDSDDLMHREKLEIDLANIKSGDYDFTISQSKFFNKNGKVVKKYWNENLWSDDPLNDFIIKKIGWGINSPLWRRKSLEKINLKFDENLMTADDYLYHIQAMQLGLKPFVCRKTLIQLRVHPQRLNEFKLKSPYKLRVNLYLMKNITTLHLNEKVICFLNQQFLRQLSNLLKNKKINIAKKYMAKDCLKYYSAETKKIAKKIYLFGVLYNFIGLGYKFLDVN